MLERLEIQLFLAYGSLCQKRETTEIVNPSCALKSLEHHLKTVHAQAPLQKILIHLFQGWGPGISIFKCSLEDSIVQPLLRVTALNRMGNVLELNT